LARRLRELAARASSALRLPAELLVDELTKREDLGSTGIGNGVSMPHARFREVKRPFGLLVRLAKPIAFDSLTGGQWIWLSCSCSGRHPSSSNSMPSPPSPASCAVTVSVFALQALIAQCPREISLLEA